jgi:hypothetical protein
MPPRRAAPYHQFGLSELQPRFDVSFAKICDD